MDHDESDRRAASLRLVVLYFSKRFGRPMDFAIWDHDLTTQPFVRQETAINGHLRFDLFNRWNQTHIGMKPYSTGATRTHSAAGVGDFHRLFHSYIQNCSTRHRREVMFDTERIY